MERIVLIEIYNGDRLLNKVVYEDLSKESCKKIIDTTENGFTFITYYI